VGADAPGPPAWFDSHCHLQERYQPESAPEEEDDEVGVAAALGRCAAAGVTRLVCVGTDLATSEQALALAAASRTGRLGPDAPEVWATVGLHPHEAVAGTGPLADLVARALDGGDGDLVGVGECGLDYFYEHSPRAEQRRAFAEQIALAHRHRLTLVIHARDAWDDLFAVLASEGVPERTVLHCFTGGPDEAVRCLEAGTYLSFSGIVTFKNADELRQAAALCPEDRLLVETDSPFLTPVPHRGRPNEPAFVPLVGARVAEVRQVAPEELARTTTRNALAAFDR
jgi:TatD DNase family protein